MQADLYLAVVVAFFVCWAPFHTQRLVAIYGTIPTDHEDRHKLVKIYEIVTYTSGVLYYFSTTINPLLYNIMSNKFRDAFRETFSRCCGLACVKSQRPQCTYSILSRSVRRGPDSHTDSTTGRDDPSVQTHITLAHKNSQESMNVQSATHRSSIKGKLDGIDASSSYYRPKNANNISIKQDNVCSEVKGKFITARINKEPRTRAAKFLNFFVRIVRRTAEPPVPGLYTSPLKESNYNIELEKTDQMRNLSTSSCDISNSSLKDIDNAVLEDELACYLRMVKCQ